MTLCYVWSLSQLIHICISNTNGYDEVGKFIFEIGTPLLKANLKT